MINYLELEKAGEQFTLSQIIAWTHAYKGKFEFLINCKKAMDLNKPLLPKQFLAVRMCCAYFSISGNTKETKSTLAELDEIVKTTMRKR
jgi:hypothetical protein